MTLNSAHVFVDIRLLLNVEIIINVNKLSEKISRVVTWCRFLKLLVYLYMLQSYIKI